jgi:hypothetical protein
MKTVTTKKELADAIKGNESTIIVKGEMVVHIKRLKTIGNAAWVVAFAAIGGAIYMAITTPAAALASAPVGGFGATIPFTGTLVAGGAAATILGIGATQFLIGLGVAAGGTAAISKLRVNYSISNKSDNELTLTKK